MSNILAELAGSEFAASYESVNLTGCRIKKEDMSMSVDLMSDAFPCVFPFDELKEIIHTKYGVSKVAFNIKYKNFELTDENKKDFYDNVRDYVCRKKPELLKVLTGSAAKISDNVLTVFIRFSTEEKFPKEKLGSMIEEYVKDTFGISLTAEFDIITEKKDELLEEIEKAKEDILTNIPQKTQSEDLPCVKEVVKKTESEEEKNENLIIGKDFSGEITPLSDITEYSGKVLVAGKIITTETRETKNGNHILSLYITDDISSITCKCFVKPDKINDITSALKGAKAVIVKGDTVYDQYEHEVTIKINSLKLKEIKSREDTAHIQRCLLWTRLPKPMNLLKLRQSGGIKL